MSSILREKNTLFRSQSVKFFQTPARSMRHQSPWDRWCWWECHSPSEPGPRSDSVFEMLCHPIYSWVHPSNLETHRMPRQWTIIFHSISCSGSRSKTHLLVQGHVSHVVMMKKILVSSLAGTPKEVVIITTETWYWKQTQTTNNPNAKQFIHWQCGRLLDIHHELDMLIIILIDSGLRSESGYQYFHHIVYDCWWNKGDLGNNFPLDHQRIRVLDASAAPDTALVTGTASVTGIGSVGTPGADWSDVGWPWEGPRSAFQDPNSPVSTLYTQKRRPMYLEYHYLVLKVSNSGTTTVFRTHIRRLVDDASRLVLVCRCCNS